jgi:hypothetical protein
MREATAPVLILCISHLHDCTCHAHLLFSLRSKYSPLLASLSTLHMPCSLMEKDHVTSHTKQRVKLCNFVCFSQYYLDIRRKQKL